MLFHFLELLANLIIYLYKMYYHFESTKLFSFQEKKEKKNKIVYPFFLLFKENKNKIVYLEAEEE